MQSFYLDAIKKFEGFTEKARWDYAQQSNGYGTRALYPGEMIDKQEAERRFAAEIATARAIVDRHAPNADEGTKAALTSLTYNAGDKWTRSGLGEAVRNGDLEAVRSLFQEYNRAGGKELEGLVTRRAAEAQWIGNGLPENLGAASPGVTAAADANDEAVTASGSVDAAPIVSGALEVQPTGSVVDPRGATVRASPVALSDDTTQDQLRSLLRDMAGRMLVDRQSEASSSSDRASQEERMEERRREDRRIAQRA
jgi:lysozyme